MNHSDENNNNSNNNNGAPRIPQAFSVSHILLLLAFIIIFLQFAAVPDWQQRHYPYDIRADRRNSPGLSSPKVNYPGKSYAFLDRYYAGGYDQPLCYLGTAFYDSAFQYLTSNDAANANSNSPLLNCVKELYSNETYLICKDKANSPAGIYERIFLSSRTRYGLPSSPPNVEQLLTMTNNRELRLNLILEEHYHSTPEGFLLPKTFIGCPHSEFAMTPFERRYHMIPLAQYHHRLPTHALTTHYVFTKRRQLRQKQYRWWFMTKNNQGTRDERLAVWVDAELEYSNTRFNMLVQRTFTRAHRHADAMRMETLHFLKLMTTTIPALKAIWKGDDFCSWPGVICETEYLPISELIDPDHPVVSAHLQYLHTRLLRSPTRAAKKGFSTDFNHAMKKRLLRQIFTNRRRRHFFLRWVGGPSNKEDASIIYPKSMNPPFIMDRYEDEMYYGIHFPEVDFTPPEIYIGSDYSDLDFFTDWDGIKYYTEGVDRHAYGDQTTVVDFTGPLTVPFTMVRLDLQKFNLKGSLPKFFDVTRYWDTPRLQGIYAAYEKKHSNMGRCEHSSEPTCEEVRRFKQEHTFVSLRQDKYFRNSSMRKEDWMHLQERFNGPFRMLLHKVYKTTSRAERVGYYTNHFDLAAYFSEVAMLAQFWGENFERISQMEVEQNQRMMNDLEPYKLEREMYFPTEVEPIIRVDDSSKFGEIVPQLVAIRSVNLSYNPLLSGQLPSEWLHLGFLTTVELHGTGVRPHLPEELTLASHQQTAMSSKAPRGAGVYYSATTLFANSMETSIVITSPRSDVFIHMQSPARPLHPLFQNYTGLREGVVELPGAPPVREEVRRSYASGIPEDQRALVKDHLRQASGVSLGFPSVTATKMLLGGIVGNGSATPGEVAELVVQRNPAPGSWFAWLRYHLSFSSLRQVFKVGFHEFSRVGDLFYQIDQLEREV